MNSAHILMTRTCAIAVVDVKTHRREAVIEVRS